jgi:hypothetical protein
MKRVFAVMATVVLLAGLSTVALAKSWTHEEARISMWFPDDWKMERERGVVTISDPREEVALVFFTLPARDLESALESLDDELEKFVTRLRVTSEPEKDTLNGMPVVTIGATGRIDGKRVEISIAVIRTPSRKALVVLGIAEKSKLRHHERTLTRIVGSLKPARRR